LECGDLSPLWPGRQNESGDKSPHSISDSLLPMDLADAALVRVAEKENLRRVFTVDRRDFSVYRPLRLGRFIISP